MTSRTIRWAVFVVAVVVVGGFSLVVALRDHEGDSDSGRKPDSRKPAGLGAEEERIVRIAMDAIGKDLDRLPDKWDVEITHEGDECVVTWPVRRPVPQIGRSFYCRVYVDGKRGVATRKMVGN